MNGWIFDVDGVITHPLEKRITDLKILTCLSNILQQEDVLAINTGRSFDWVLERVIAPLEAHVKYKKLLEKLFIVLEKGNVTALYKGSFIKQVYGDKISKDFERDLEQLMKDEFSDSMFLGEHKSTMATAEMQDNCDPEKYLEEQKKFIPKLEELLTKPEYKKLNLKVDNTHSSTDIQPQNAGKHLGARRIEEWLKEKGIAPQKLYMFGDNQSDIEMAEELENEYPTIFVYTNQKDTLKVTSIKSEIVYTDEKFTKGTLEFLQSYGL